MLTGYPRNIGRPFSGVRSSIPLNNLKSGKGNLQQKTLNKLGND